MTMPQVEDGNFVISTPLPAGEEGKVIEWHYVRERSEEEWASLKPRNIKYQSDTPGLSFKALGGTERDGHWVERVLVTHVAMMPARLNCILKQADQTINIR
ncbi:invasin [Salmonella enterica subsp. arizonae]|uniref:Invasin n=1 Tax=Salmonella enterica subsp. arizonae TaxID=59203 RepID=A0A2X4WLM1_SALER|nr:invasin [Salmonella enterica subsp. arizonae]